MLRLLKYSGLALLTLGFLPTPSTGQDTTQSSLRALGFPLAGYSPETRWIGGLYGMMLIGDPATGRPGSIGLSLLGSQNRQYTVNLFPELWWAQNAWHLAGELKLQHWPDRFYGIGNDTRKEERVDYTSRIAGIKLDLQRRFLASWYAGFLLEIEQNVITEGSFADTVSFNVQVPGGDRSLIAGLGLGLAYDSRDDIFFPRSGSYLQLRMVSFNHMMGSTHPHLKLIFDLRKYWNPAGEHYCRLQFYNKWLFGREVPFRNMALLGGDKLLRGYYRGRYRDHHLIMLQGEYFSPPLRHFRLVIFAGAGDVYHDPGEGQRLRLKPSGGVGLRYRVFRDRKLNIRFDMAVAKVSRGMYLTISEAF